MALDVQTSAQEQMQETVADERARKRQAIGLSAQRPTARRAIQRPSDDRNDGPAWAAVGLLAVLSLATALLVVAALQNVTVERLFGLTPPTPAAPERLLLADDFHPPFLDLAQGAEAASWSMGFDEGIYRIRIEQPGNLAWTTLGMLDLPPYRLETAVVVAQETEWGYAGMLGRYQNDGSFYLFAVDGRGAFQVQLQLAGRWYTLQSWTPNPAVQVAGVENRLALEDNGQGLRFFANDILLFETSGVRLPPGDLGLAAGARSQGETQAGFHWLRIYEIPLAETEYPAVGALSLPLSFLTA